VKLEFAAHTSPPRRAWRAFLISSPDLWPDLFPFFFCGAAFYIFRERIPKTATLFCVAVLALLLSAFYGHLYLTCLVCGTYAVLFSALSTESSVKIGGRKVDLSYGIYLYGWPIQQLLLFLFLDRMTPFLLFPSAIIFTAATAWASWQFIEAPCLRLVRHTRPDRSTAFGMQTANAETPLNEAASIP
jgi:peptidoglycan/LPS O-acetylase OafA/YrhL